MNCDVKPFVAIQKQSERTLTSSIGIVNEMFNFL